MTPNDVDELAGRLRTVFDALQEPLAIAVSGGIDSLTLATAACRWADDRTVMFHAVSPAVPGDATARVERIAAQQGWRLTVIDAGEFGDANYRANPVNRCFFCKTNLYNSIGRHTSSQILSGANRDDLGEYRPGLDAAKANGARHPYLEADIDKSGVRQLARGLGLGDLAELPAAPCLSSRVETGIPIRPDVLKAIHTVERGLAQDFPRGTIRCRVRATGIVVELDPATLTAVLGLGIDKIRSNVSTLFANLPVNPDVSFAPYRNGSAFLHDRAG